MSFEDVSPEENPDQCLQRLFDEYWQFTLHENPILATRFGAHHYDERLPEKDPDAFERRYEKESEFLSGLREVPKEKATDEYQLNYELFDRILQWSVREYELGVHYMHFNQLFGCPLTLLQLPLQIPLETVEHHENYITRLSKVPSFVEDHIELLSRGIEEGFVQPEVALEGVEEQLLRLARTEPEDSPFYGPFHELPGWISDDKRGSLKEEAQTVISNAVIPAFDDFLTFYRDTYYPAARTEISCETLPDGERYYQFLVDKFTTSHLSPEEIHELGKQEVNRLTSEMEQVVTSVDFDGTVQEFADAIRSDERFYVDEPEELLRRYRDICKRMDAELPNLFGHLPRAEYGVRPMPEESAEDATSAYYLRPSADGRTPGWFMVNTYDLDSRPTFEMEALALHEAVPGHHLQIALQQEQSGLVDFRRVATFMGFTEGWGLYAEKLGTEAGFYNDPYAEFGRLSFSIWRAARLVVDTGIHHFGWEREEAVNYLMDHTALTRTNVESEVDRYIAMPAQALSYKIGERKILELRAKAQQELGDRFSIRDFHDHLLGAGTMPLDMLDRRMKEWIEDQKRDMNDGTDESE